MTLYVCGTTLRYLSKTAVDPSYKPKTPNQNQQNVKVTKGAKKPEPQDVESQWDRLSNI